MSNEPCCLYAVCREVINREYVGSTIEAVQHIATTLFQMVPRGLSLNDVCAALRPFYSVVHPDRFARNPRVKEQNERSLQVSSHLGIARTNGFLFALHVELHLVHK